MSSAAARQAKRRSVLALVKLRTRDPRVSQGGRLLFNLLWHAADANLSRCYPGREQLAEWAGKDIKWVERHLKELVGAGWIEVGKRRTAAGGVSNLYHFLFPEDLGEGVWVQATTPKSGVVE